MDQAWQGGASPPNLNFMHDYTEALLGDLAPGSPAGRALVQASLGGQDDKPFGASPADKKRRRDEELGLKQWMENLGKPDPPEDLLQDDTMLFSGADGLDFPMPGSYSMAGDPGAHGGMGHYGGAAPGMPLVLPTEHGGGHVIAAWEPPPQDAENGSAEQARGKGGRAASAGTGMKRVASRGGRGRAAAAAQPVEDLTESEKAAVSKACRERARRERLNDSFIELGELLDPGKPSRTDKVSIIADAVKAITQLRAEAHQLRQLNKFLEERVSHSEKEKSHLMMQQALITQFMQTGQPVVLGGTQPPANMWGQQQVAGPPPQVPASGQSMGQAVADISAGLRLMQQSPGSSLPPWPLPPGAQSQGAGPSHAAAPAPTTGPMQVISSPMHPAGSLPAPQQQQQQQQLGGGVQRTQSPLQGLQQQQQQQQQLGGVQRTESPLQGVQASQQNGGAAQHSGQPSGSVATNGEANQVPTVPNTVKPDIGIYQASPLQLSGVSQSPHQQGQLQPQQFAVRPGAQQNSYAPPPSQQGQQQQFAQFAPQQYTAPFSALPPNLAPPMGAPFNGQHPGQQQPQQQHQLMQSPYVQDMGTFSPGSIKPSPPAPVMPGPFWLGGLDTDTSNDHVRRPPAA